MEEFSVETNWKLAGLLNNQGCKNDARRIGEEGTKSNRVGTSAPGRGLRGKGRLDRQRASLGSEWFEPQIRCPSPGVLCQGDKPRWLVGGPRGPAEGSGDPGLDSSLEESVCTGLPPGRVERAPLVAAGCPATAPCTPAQARRMSAPARPLHITGKHGLVQGQSLGGAGAATAGTYSSSATQAAQISYGSGPTRAHPRPPRPPQRVRVAHLPCRDVLQQVGAAEAGAVRGKRGLAWDAVSEQRHGHQCIRPLSTAETS